MPRIWSLQIGFYNSYSCLFADCRFICMRKCKHNKNIFNSLFSKHCQNLIIYVLMMNCSSCFSGFKDKTNGMHLFVLFHFFVNKSFIVFILSQSSGITKTGSIYKSQIKTPSYIREEVFVYIVSLAFSLRCFKWVFNNFISKGVLNFRLKYVIAHCINKCRLPSSSFPYHHNSY